MAELRRVFIQNLKFYRKQKGFRQLDLALDLGKNPNYINSIENGKYFPSPETIEQIAEILGIEPILLFEELPSNPQPSQDHIDIKMIEFRLKEVISSDISRIFAESWR